MARRKAPKIEAPKLAFDDRPYWSGLKQSEQDARLLRGGIMGYVEQIGAKPLADLLRELADELDPSH